MFISKGCLQTIFENLSILNKEVEELKKTVCFNNNSKQTVHQTTNYLKNH